MNRKWMLYYPLLLALSLFLLDKAALWEPLRLLGRPDPTPMENMIRSLDVTLRQYGEDVKSGKDRRPMVLFLGSSRSEFFRHLTPELIRKTPGLTAEERSRFAKIRIEPRYAYKAGDLFIQLLFLDTILKQKNPPSLVVMEFSPEMLNKNSPTNISKYIYENILDYDFLSVIYPFLKGENALEVRNRFLFASYAYRFRPERALMRFLKGEEPSSAPSMAQLMILARPATEALPGDFADYPEDDIPEEIYKTHFVGYAEYLRKEFVLQKFEFSSEELNSLYTALDLAKKKGVRIALWSPYVHPVLREEWKRVGLSELFPQIQKELHEKEKGLPYFDAGARPGECRRFVDASHLSPLCAPRLTSKILEEAERVYGTKIFAPLPEASAERVRRTGDQPQ